MNDFIRENWFIVLCGILGLLIFIGFVGNIFYVSYEINKFCIEKGWSGSMGDDYCYKNIPSYTGLGSDRTLSGHIKDDVKEWRKNR
jgi:hypothetical protein